MSKTLWGGHTGLGQGRRQAPLPSRSVKASRLAQVGLRSAFPDMLLLPLGEAVRVSNGAPDSERQCSQGPVLWET